MAIIDHLFRTVCAAVVALLTRVIPRTNLIWVFGGGKGLKYAGNPMYFFKYCARHCGDRRRIVWLTHSPNVVREISADGYEAHRIWSPKGLWLGLRARWHIFNVSPSDTGPTSCGARQLNLWHGIPMKNIRFMRPRLGRRGWRDYINNWILREKLQRRGQLVLSPNHTYVQQMLDAFDVSAAQIVYANLPRNIVFEDAEAPEAWCKSTDRHVLKQLQLLAAGGSHIIGYFPTWRGRGMADLFLGATKISQIDHINSYLRSNNLYLLTKWHDCTYNTYAHEGQNAAAEDLTGYLSSRSNIIVLDFSSDLNSHLPYCELLITDYSSVMFDWLLTCRPFLFVAYDLEEYQQKWGFNFNYEQLIPGPLVRTVDQFLDALDSWIREGDFGFRRHIEELRNKFFEFNRSPDHIVAAMMHAESKPEASAQ